jgi:hypothetical protein
MLGCWPRFAGDGSPGSLPPLHDTFQTSPSGPIELLPWLSMAGDTRYPIREEAGHGWASSFPEFQSTPAFRIRGSLQDFLRDVSSEQVRAWDLSIPPLQREVREVLLDDSLAADYTAILEYELPLEFRRPDVVLLMGGAVLVLELKGRRHANRADIDQAAGTFVISRPITASAPTDRFMARLYSPRPTATSGRTLASTSSESTQSTAWPSNWTFTTRRRSSSRADSWRRMPIARCLASSSRRGSSSSMATSRASIERQLRRNRPSAGSLRSSTRPHARKRGASSC